MSAFANLRDSARRVLQRPISYATSEWERTSPRQRRLIQILAVTVLVVSIAVFAWALYDSVGTLQDENAEIREALAMISKHREDYLEQKTRSASQEARIGTEPPQLTADLEAAAREETVQIAEQSERPNAPAGRRYIEHDVDIKIREVDLQTLTKFLRRVETGQRLIFFTHLSIKKRYSESEKLDVEATATAFERVHEDKKKKGEAKPAEGKKE
jgi:Tfp pilus assembly protein PilO